MVDANPPTTSSNGLFRTSFALDVVPARVPARITADSRYALYVNGQDVSSGPFILDLEGKPEQEFQAGRYEIV